MLCARNVPRAVCRYSEMFPVLREWARIEWNSLWLEWWLYPRAAYHVCPVAPVLLSCSPQQSLRSSHSDRLSWEQLQKTSLQTFSCLLKAFSSWERKGMPATCDWAAPQNYILRNTYDVLTLIRLGRAVLWRVILQMETRGGRNEMLEKLHPHKGK